MESIRHSESIVLPRAKSMAFNKQIFMNFDSPCMASVTTTMLSPILHCVRYHIFKLQKMIIVCNESASNHMGCLKQYVKFTRSDTWKYTETHIVTTKHGISQSVRL